MEGGLEWVASDNAYYECGWCTAVDRTGTSFSGSTARAPVGQMVLDRLLKNGEELGDVIDELAQGCDLRTSEGYMGLITNGGLPRALCYSHGVMFAMAPFVSDSIYWRDSPPSLD